MDEVDEPFSQDLFDDAQEFIATQQEEHQSLLSKHGESDAENLNLRVSQNDTFKVPDTASYEGILEVPESITRENIWDVTDVTKGTSHEPIVDVPERATHEDILDFPQHTSAENILDVPERGPREDILDLPDRASPDCEFPCLNILSPLRNLRDDSEVESDDASSGSSMFRTQCLFTPTRTGRNRSLARSPQRRRTKAPYEESSDSAPEPVTRFNLKELFERRRKRRRNRRIRKGKARQICSETVKHVPEPCVSIPPPRQQRRWKDEAFQFPFLRKKDLTLRMIFTYEQASLWGFLHQIKKLKYGRHLQASLQNMEVGKDSEDGRIEGRGYSYLDDEGPISPIAELSEDGCCDDTELPEAYDAKIVDNSCFILNWNPPPKKKQSKKRKKKTKQHVQKELDPEEAQPMVTSHTMG